MAVNIRPACENCQRPCGKGPFCRRCRLSAEVRWGAFEQPEDLTARDGDGVWRQHRAYYDGHVGVKGLDQPRPLQEFNGHRLRRTLDADAILAFCARRDSGLTRVQLEIASDFWSEELTRAEISVKRKISERTVQDHVANVRRARAVWLALG